MTDTAGLKAPLDWNDSASVVTTWARLNINSHIHGTIAKWIVNAERELAEAKRGLAFKDETNRCLQACLEGEVKLKAELAEAKAQARTPGIDARQKRYFKTEAAAKRAVTMWKKRMRHALPDQYIFHEIVDGKHCWSVWL